MLYLQAPPGSPAATSTCTKSGRSHSRNHLCFSRWFLSSLNKCSVGAYRQDSPAARLSLPVQPLSAKSFEITAQSPGGNNGAARATSKGFAVLYALTWASHIRDAAPSQASGPILPPGFCSDGPLLLMPPPLPLPSPLFSSDGLPPLMPSPQLRRQGSTLAPFHTQTRAGCWTSLSPGSCMGVE